MCFVNKKSNLLFILILIFGIIFIFYADKKENSTLEKVQLNNKSNAQNLAIMVQKEDLSGYEETEIIPNGLFLNSMLSGCIDSNGDNIDGVIEYNIETLSLKLKSKGTSYCYLYFDRDNTPPIVTVAISGNNTLTPKLEITSNEAGTYCVNTSNTISNINNCIYNGNILENETITTDTLIETNIYYVHIQDIVGNIGMSEALNVKVGYPLAKYLIDNDVPGLEKTIIEGDTLYRFSGTNGNTDINNYICLGTTSKCTDGSENMYRIIGVEPSTEYIKVIKQTQYGNAIQFDDLNESSITWENADIHSTLKNWINTLSFKDLIVEHDFGDGSFANAQYNRKQVLSSEAATSVKSKVGILSLSDFYLAYRTDISWYSYYASHYQKNWIHLVNNHTNGDEWTRTRAGTIYSWIILSNGQLKNYNKMNLTYVIRPVFYLDSTVSKLNGTGTINDPFIIL